MGLEGFCLFWVFWGGFGGVNVFCTGALPATRAAAVARGVVRDALVARVQVAAARRATATSAALVTALLAALGLARGRREAVLARHDGAVEAVRRPVLVPERVGGDGARRRHDGAVGQPHRGARRHGRVRPRADARLVRPALRRDVQRRRARRRALAVVEELAGLRQAADLDGAVARARGALADGDARGLLAAVKGRNGRRALGVDARLVGVVVRGRGVLGGHEVGAEDAPPLAGREALRLRLVGRAVALPEGRLRRAGRLALRPDGVGHAGVADAVVGVLHERAGPVAAVLDAGGLALLERRVNLGPERALLGGGLVVDEVVLVLGLGRGLGHGHGRRGHGRLGCGRVRCLSIAWGVTQGEA